MFTTHRLLRDTHSVAWYLCKTIFKMYIQAISHICTTFIYTYQRLFPHLFPFQRYICTCRKTPVLRFTLVLNKEALKERKWHFQDKYDWDILNFHSRLKSMHWTAVKQPVTKHTHTKGFLLLSFKSILTGPLSKSRAYLGFLTDKYCTAHVLSCLCWVLNVKMQMCPKVQWRVRQGLWFIKRCCQDSSSFERLSVIC